MLFSFFFIIHRLWTNYISGLWAIVSNAGFNIMGDVELLTLDLYKKAMNVNFYGAIRMIRNFTYLVRYNKGKHSVSPGFMLRKKNNVFKQQQRKPLRRDSGYWLKEN